LCFQAEAKAKPKWHQLECHASSNNNHGLYIVVHNICLTNIYFKKIGKKIQSYDMHIQQKYLLSSVRSSGVKRKNCIKKHEMKNMAETRMELY
jgi:hypothetical protein